MTDDVGLLILEAAGETSPSKQCDTYISNSLIVFIIMIIWTGAPGKTVGFGDLIAALAIGFHANCFINVCTDSLNLTDVAHPYLLRYFIFGWREIE